MICCNNGKCHSTQCRLMVLEIITCCSLTVHSIHYLISYHPSIPHICLPMPNRLSITTPHIQQLPTLIQPYISHTLYSICLLAATHPLIPCSILHRIWHLMPNYSPTFLMMAASLANQQPPWWRFKTLDKSSTNTPHWNTQLERPSHMVLFLGSRVSSVPSTIPSISLMSSVSSREQASTFATSAELDTILARQLTTLSAQQVKE